MRERKKLCWDLDVLAEGSLQMIFVGNKVVWHDHDHDFVLSPPRKYWKADHAFNLIQNGATRFNKAYLEIGCYCCLTVQNCTAIWQDYKKVTNRSKVKQKPLFRFWNFRISIVRSCCAVKSNYWRLTLPSNMLNMFYICCKIYIFDYNDQV